jgi:hypothetical protein
MSPRTIKPKIPAIQPDPSDLLTLFELHLSWYPLMELRDVYKLLYQGVMGAEHLIPSREEYTRYLEAEFEPLLPDQTERLLEPVRPDGVLYRLNLRPYKARQEGLDRLIPYLLDTAHKIAGSITDLQATWVGFIILCKGGQITQFSTDLVFKFGDWLGEMAFPAVHHSKIYSRAYRPAYRLLAAKFIPELGIEVDLSSNKKI